MPTHNMRELINQALALIGETPIPDLTSTPRARALADIYDQVLQEEQAAIDWPELTTRTSLEGEVDPVIDGAYRYPLPEDLCRMVSAARNYTTEGAYLIVRGVTSADPDLDIVYQRYDDDETVYSRAMQAVLVYAMAGRAAATVTASAPLAAHFEQLAEQQRHRLRTTPQTGVRQPIRRSPADGGYLAARHLRR